MSDVSFPSQDAFRAWLTIADPDAVISHNGGCVGCPLSNYLRWLGWPDAAVFSNGSWSPDGILADDDRVFEMPDWARGFVSLVDKQVGLITAADCLSMLDTGRIALALDRLTERLKRPLPEPVMALWV